MEDNSGRSVIANFGALGDMIHQDNVKMLTLLKDISDKLNEQSKFEEDSSISMQEIYDLLDRRLPEDGAQNVPKEILDKEGDIQNDDMLDRLDRIAAILEGMQNNLTGDHDGGGIDIDLGGRKSKWNRKAISKKLPALLPFLSKFALWGSVLSLGGDTATLDPEVEKKSIEIQKQYYEQERLKSASTALKSASDVLDLREKRDDLITKIQESDSNFTEGYNPGDAENSKLLLEIESELSKAEKGSANLPAVLKSLGITDIPKDKDSIDALAEQIQKRLSGNSSNVAPNDVIVGGGGSGSLSGGAGNDRLGVGGGGGGSSSGGILRANMRYVGNEEYVPSTRLSSKQMAEIEAGLAKGVVYPIDVLRDYYAQKNADTLSSETMMRQNSAEYGNGPTGDEILPGAGGGTADSGRAGSGGSDGGGSGNVDSSMYSGKNSGKLFDLIDKTEGGGNYDTLFGHSQRSGGRYSGVKVSEMTLGELYDFTDPNKPGGYGNWVGGQVGRFATPMGRYQIVGKTLRAVAQAMNLPPDTVFSPEIQDRMANYLASQRLAKGKTMAEKRRQLRAEWEGFKHVSNEDLDAAIRQFETSGSGTARSSTGSWLESGKAMGGNLMDLLSGMIDTGSDSGFISQMSQKAALARDLPAKAKTVVVPPAAPTPTATSTPYGTSNPDPGDPLPSISDFAKRIFDHSPMFKPQ